MSFVIIGSTAIRMCGLAIRGDRNVDFDVFTDSPDVCSELSDLEGNDVHIVPSNVMAHFKSRTDSGKKHASLRQVLTIKMSHLGWDNHAWYKHKDDILNLLSHGVSPDMDLYHDLLAWWKEELGNKSFLSLSQNKDEFFTDAVGYRYDHDYLHELVSYPNRPVYEKVRKDGHDVLIDKEKFFDLPHHEQIRMFREEIAVIAVERWCIPSDGAISWYKAHLMSLRKTITTLTKGWATEFIVFNLKDFIVPDFSYYKNILTTIKETQSMSSKNSEQLTALMTAIAEEISSVSDHPCEVDELVYNMCEGDVYSSVKEVLEKYDYEHLEQDGGGEGGSEYCYGIFKLDGRVYKAEYSYYSYHGHEFSGITNNLSEVKPVTKTVTVYE